MSKDKPEAGDVWVLRGKEATIKVRREDGVLVAYWSAGEDHGLYTPEYLTHSCEFVRSAGEVAGQGTKAPSGAVKRERAIPGERWSQEGRGVRLMVRASDHGGYVWDETGEQWCAETMAIAWTYVDSPGIPSETLPVVVMPAFETPPGFYDMGVGYLLPPSPVSAPAPERQGGKVSTAPSAAVTQGNCGRITLSGIPCDLQVGHKERECKVLPSKSAEWRAHLQRGVSIPVSSVARFHEYAAADRDSRRMTDRHDSNLRTQEPAKQRTEGYEPIHATKGGWGVFNLRGK